VRRAIQDLYGEGAAMLSAVTGLPVSADDLRASARTLHHLKKLFNQRQGWSAQEDVLPERFLHVENGTGAAIDPATFYSARSHYYRQRGWDESGCLPTELTLLAHLGLNR
jgi:aldehyde:ferredoxin oxidoreductase